MKKANKLKTHILLLPRASCSKKHVLKHFFSPKILLQNKKINKIPNKTCPCSGLDSA